MKIVKKYNIKVLKRSSKLSKDKTKTIDVIFDVLKNMRKKIIKFKILFYYRLHHLSDQKK